MPVCSCQIGAGAEMAGTVPETVLKKRKRDEEWATKKAAQQADAKKKAKESRKEIFKRAEQYVKEYRAKVCTRVALCGARRHPLCVQSLQRAAKRCSVCTKCSALALKPGSLQLVAASGVLGCTWTGCSLC